MLDGHRRDGLEGAVGAQVEGEALDLGLGCEALPDELVLGSVVEDPAVAFLGLEG